MFNGNGKLWPLRKSSDRYPLSSSLKIIEKLEDMKEAELRLLICSKEGSEILFQCLMGTVNSGSFVNHLTDILSPLP